MQKADCVVIGAGSGGLTVAVGLAKAGRKVWLFEKGEIGGDCTNFGCIPSKRLLHLAKSQESNDPFEEVRRTIRKVQEHESVENLSNLGIRVIPHEAFFVSNATIGWYEHTELQTVCPNKIVISTGASPKIPSEISRDHPNLHTYESIFQITSLPKKFLVIGGGPIGVELAFAFHQLGSTVTILQKGSALLPKEEESIQISTLRAFQKMGIQVHLETSLLGCSDNYIEVGQNDGSTFRQSFDQALVATGRTPNTHSLQLKNTNIVCSSSGHIQTNRSFKTSLRHVYAIGDVASHQQFTHVANNMGREVVKSMLMPLTWRRKKAVPRVTFIHPEIASIGLRSNEAVEKYGLPNVHVIRIPISSLDRGITDSLTGEMTFVVKKFSGKILGATLQCRNAGELISIITLAIDKNISIWSLGSIIYPYPTLSEALKVANTNFLFYTIKNWRKDLLNLLYQHRLKLLTVSLWGLLIGAFFYIKMSQQLTNLDIAQSLFTWLVNDPFGSVFYILIYILRPVFLFPATLLTLLSGMVFGPIWGILYTIVGENGSAAVAYYIGRILGNSTSESKDIESLSLWKKRIHKNSFFSILIMRLLYFPFDLVNYGAGYLQVKFSSFLTATFIGILPGVLAFVLLGASIKGLESFDPKNISLDPILLISGAMIFVVSLGISKILHKSNLAK